MIAPVGKPAFETARLAFRLLGPGEEAALQAVFESAPDYFRRLNEQDALAPDAAARELRSCAQTPGRELALLSRLGDGSAAGAIGWWRGHPEPDVVLLGMLLVVPALRGRGLAREAVEGLEVWLAGQGIRRLRTAVPAHAFAEHDLLRALGFALLPIREHTALGLAGAHLMLFEKRLGG